jgi:hypothetical protein
MSLKTAAFFAFIAMLLLTVVVALAFLREITALANSAVAPVTVLSTAIELLAALAVTIFFFVYFRAKSR